MGASEQFLTAREYADRFGLSVSKVTKLLRDGGITGQKVAGKWMIPANALDAAKSPGASAEKSPTRKGHADTAALSPPAAPPGRTYSVAEFSAMTFLTENGVRDWLKKGILKGAQVQDGEWRIDAANLEIPNIKRLVR